MTAGRVLVVDAEASIVQWARPYLEREGFRVQFVNDGLKAQ